MRHLFSVAFAMILCAGCLSAPANDQDRAGEQRIRQDQQNSPMRMDREASKAVTVNVTMTGEGATLNFQPNSAHVTGAVETGGNQSGQGSTDAAQGATQEPRANQEIPVEVSVPVK